MPTSVPDPATVRAYDDRQPSPARTRTATFGLGCFWGPDARFGGTDGVVRTRVGYAGGTTPDPTYREIGDHTEVVQVDYDPATLRYEDLLAAAFDAHDHRRQPSTAQYQHLVLHEDGGREAVDAFLAERFPETRVATRIAPLDAFTVAEDYHQKYQLRSDPLAEAFAGYDDAALRESPAAAALNGAAVGHDRPAALASGTE